MNKEKQITINIIQANLHRSPAAMTELIQLMFNENHQIALCTEPPTYKKIPYCIHKSFKAFYSITTQERIRSCILIKESPTKDLQPRLIPNQTNADCTTIQINSKNPDTITLTSIYLEPTTGINDPKNTIHLIEKANNKNWIVTGDLNAESPYWGSERLNLKGNHLTEILTNMDLTTVIIKNTPTCCTTNTQGVKHTVIDATMATEDILPKINNYRNRQYKIASTDHSTITFEITITPKPPKKSPRPTRLDYQNIKWEDFNETLLNLLTARNISQERIANITQTEELNEITNTYTEVIKEAAMRSTTKRKPTKKIYPWWWNDEIDQLTKQIITIKRKMKWCGMVKLERYNTHKKQLTEQLRRTIQSSKTEIWQQLVQKTDELSIWSIINIIKTRNNFKGTTQLMNEKGDIIDENETAKALAIALFGKEEILTTPDRNNQQDSTRSQNLETKSQQNNTTSHHNNTISQLNDTISQQTNTISRQNDIKTRQKEAIKKTTRSTNKTIMTKTVTPDYPITDNEIEYIFKEVNPKKTPGEDGINSSIYEQARITNPNIFKSIFQKSLDLGKIPDSWKKSIVIPIHKPKKGTPMNPNNYRPIGLLSMAAKGLEKVVNTRIVYEIISRNLINPNQHGFTPNKSTITALQQLTETMEKYKKNFKCCAILALDIAGAFDNLPWDKTITQMQKLGINEKIINLMTDYFKGRKYEIIYGTSKYSYKPTKGCVQGSPLSPTLWNIIINPLLESTNKIVHAQAYADDIVFIIGASKETKLIDKIKQTYNIAQEWAKENNLSFALEKTELMAFKGKIKSNFTIGQQQQEIKSQKSIKILGLIIDKNLNFKEHTTKTIMKANTIYNIMKSITLKGMGANSKLRKLCYNMIFVPTISYAAEIWGSALHNNEIRRRIRETQRKILIKMTGAYSQTNLADLLSITQQTALDYHIESIKNKHDLIQGKETTINYSTRGIEVEKKQYFYQDIAPWELPKINIEVINEDENMADTTTTYIATKGVKNQNGPGAAYTIMTKNEINYTRQVRIDQTCSLFHAELAPIKDSLIKIIQESNKRYVKSKDKISHLAQNKRLILYIESKPIAQAIKNIKNSNPLINQIFIAVKNLQDQGYQLTFKQTSPNSSHILFTTNKETATQAIKSHAKPSYAKIPLKEIKNEVKKWSLTKTQHYIEEKASNNLKNLLRTPFLCTPIIPAREAIWMLTGHGPFNVYLKRIEKITSDICECKKAPQNPIHLLTDCNIMEQIRHINTSQRNPKLTDIQDLINAQEYITTFEQLAIAICKKLQDKENR